MKKSLISLFIVSVFLVLLFLFLDKPFIESEEKVSTETGEQAMQIPQNLSLPFKTKDISLTTGVVNPIGVVRFSKDLPDVGHSGLDVPLIQGAAIYAVADGEITAVETASDPWEGMKVVQLLQRTSNGEGWGFLYEHIKPAKDIKVGVTVKRGDLIGTKIPPNDFTAHFQLSYLFNEYKYTREMECWPDFLNNEAASKLNAWWNTYKASKTLLTAWETTTEEGKHPFRGLLNKAVYPNGPQLCYSIGTDVR